MTAPGLVRNPHVDAAAEGADALLVNAFSTARGFTRTLLTRDGSPGFPAALRLLAEPGLPHPFSAAESLDLWSAGLLALPAELPPAIAARAFSDSAPAFARDGHAVLSGCVSGDMAARLAAHFAAELAAGRLDRSRKGPDRDVAHNDPAGRVLSAALRGAVESVVGHPVKPSYSFASLYREGAELVRHVDRPQCEYTLSLLLDYRPSPGPSPAPWPVLLFPSPEAPPIECRQTVGGALLFRGRLIPHARPPLPDGHRCWVLLLHYVDTQFDGALE